MHGFVDLRPGHHVEDGGVEESFWPSFTDLMMVVVMIFLVTTSVLYLRNWQMVQEMSQMVEAERLARELAQKNMRDSQRRASQLAQTEQALAEERAELDSAHRESERLGLSLNEAQRTLVDLQQLRDQLLALNATHVQSAVDLGAERDRLDERLSAVRRVRDETTALLRSREQELAAARAALAAAERSSAELSLSLAERDAELIAQAQSAQTLPEVVAERDEALAQLALAQAELSRLDSEGGDADAALQLARDEVTRLRGELSTLQDSSLSADLTIEQLRDERDANSDRLTQLRTEYTALKNQYDKLLRPARSPAGRYVVTLRHRREGAALVTDIRLPGESRYHRVDPAQMHRRLGELLAEQGDLLYLKIVYPDNSGLSHDEAWSFSNDVLPKYDYYYREAPLGEQ